MENGENDPGKKDEIGSVIKHAVIAENQGDIRSSWGEDTVCIANRCRTRRSRACRRITGRVQVDIHNFIGNLDPFFFLEW